MTAYYNDNDPAARAALEELIRCCVIAPGVVDERSIKDVRPDDLRGFTQCHFFAGGGLWSVGARMAGWPDDKPLWSGSCPCQPFSSAGKQLGTDDPRHLWPYFHALVTACRPAIVVGEQVGKAAGYGWFDGVRSDLEGENYACRAVDIPACSINSPQERNRLFWFAVAGSDSCRRDRGTQDAQWSAEQRIVAERSNAFGDVVNLPIIGRREGGPEHVVQRGQDTVAGTDAWSDFEWIECHDGKARRAKPGIPMLVDGFSGRVDIWRIAGNAIVPQIAAEVLGAWLDEEAASESLTQLGF